MVSIIRERRIRRTAARGFSMIEVLITMLIISLALLGTTGLQAYSLRLGQGGQFRTQAVFLVADLAERMEANKPAAVAGSYVLATSSTANTLSDACSATGACSGADLAAYDLSVWQNEVAVTLPQASWSVAQTVAGNPTTYTITISWVDRRTDTTYSTSGSGETLSYTATRTIAN